MQRVKPIQIMIVDNHKGVRMGVRTYLELHTDLELVAEASNGEEAMTLYIKDKPDLVLMDLFLPDTSGITLMQNLKLINSRVPMIMLTTLKGSRLSEVVMSAGAVCLIDKGESGKKLVSAVRETMDNIKTDSAWLRSSPGDIDKLGTIMGLTRGKCEGAI